MPLVFVHGVASRNSPQAQARIRQRDALFRKLVLPPGSRVFDPDWGSNAVSFTRTLPWLPKPGSDEAFSGSATGAVASSDTSIIGPLAARNLELAIDVAFEAAMEASVLNSQSAEGDGLEPSHVDAFEAAVRYIEDSRVDESAFAPTTNDLQFLKTLQVELSRKMSPGIPAVESMGLLDDTLQWMRRGLESVVNPVRNVASDALLRSVRAPLSEQVALFLGDIFVYLRWRETHGQAGTVNRIFAPIANDLVEASRLRSSNDPLIVIGHSLGGVILYDLLTDAEMVRRIEQQAGVKLSVDLWLTVGSQPGLFADMGLYKRSDSSSDKPLPRPASVAKWLNVYDYTDVLSFSCTPLFENVEDLEFDNVTGLFSAHTAYFQRPSFYHRLRSRLKK